MKEIIDIVHKSILPFFDVCEKEEEPLSDKDKLLLKVNKAICNNLKALEQKQKTGWIPVSERLPEESDYCESDYCLCCDKDGYMTIGFISKWSKEWCFVDDEIYIDVVAWMPLPKPYEPQERSEK